MSSLNGYRERSKRMAQLSATIVWVNTSGLATKELMGHRVDCTGDFNSEYD
jgi:hypothetical protein